MQLYGRDKGFFCFWGFCILVVLYFVKKIMSVFFSYHMFPLVLFILFYLIILSICQYFSFNMLSITCLQWIWIGSQMHFLCWNWMQRMIGNTRPLLLLKASMRKRGLHWQWFLGSASACFIFTLFEMLDLDYVSLTLNKAKM